MPRYTRVFFYKEYLATCDMITEALTDPHTTKNGVLALLSSLHEILDLYEAKWTADYARHTRFSEFEKINTLKRERVVVEEKGGLLDFATQNWLSTCEGSGDSGQSKSDCGESEGVLTGSDMDREAGVRGEEMSDHASGTSKMFEEYGYDDKQEEFRRSSKMFEKVEMNEKKKRADEKERRKEERRSKFIDDLAASIHRQFGEKLQVGKKSAVDKLKNDVETSTPYRSLKKRLSFQVEENLDTEEEEYGARFNLSDRLMGFGGSMASRSQSSSMRQVEDADNAQSYISRVSLPDFNGKEDFSLWWSTFETLVDRSSEPVAVKFLRLKTCLKGDAYEIVKYLPHDALSYELAKNKLLDHFGGEQRNVYRLYNEAASFGVIEREDDLVKLRQLSCLLLKIIRALVSTMQEHEVGSGALCFICTSKLPPDMIVRFHEWRDRKREAHTLTSLSKYLEEAIARRTAAMETVYGLPKKTPTVKKTGRAMLVDSSDAAANLSNNGGQRKPENGDKAGNAGGGGLKKRCKICSKNHYIWDCDEFKNLSTEVKWKKVRDAKLCFRCLSFKHQSPDCTSQRVCGVNKCNAKHHRLLHDEVRFQQWLASRNAEAGGTKEEKKSEPMKTSSSTNAATDHDVHSNAVNAVLGAKSYAKRNIVLRTVPVMLINGNISVKVNALLDEGSCLSFVNRDVAEHLGLEGEKIQSEVKVFEGNSVTSMTQLVKLTVGSVDGRFRHTDMAELTDKVVGTMQAFDWNTAQHNWPHLANIPFPEIARPAKVDVLLGSNFIDLMVAIQKEVGGGIGQPKARLTPLGWTCVGDVTDSNSGRHSGVYGCWKGMRTQDQIKMEHALEQMWSWEEPKTGDSYKTRMEAYAEEQVNRSLKKLDVGYMVAIPYKNGKQPVLPNNYARAYVRMISTERQLRKYGPEAIRQYNQAFRDYIAYGYFEVVVHVPGIEGKVWYLVHFPVVRWDKASSKVRPVYDPNDEYKGHCLSEEELVGPKFQQDLVKVLLRFRRYAVAIGSDIAKMYMQVLVEENERDYQRVLWRWMEEDKEPTIYRSTRVVFGRKSSPYLALKVARENALAHKAEYPKAASTILDSTYMDDSLDSERSTEEAVELKRQLDCLWRIAGMEPGKWMSNCPDFLATIPEEQRAQKVDILRSVEAKIKTLGVLWYALLDEFGFVISVAWSDEVTKRRLLKLIAGIFDPLGMLLPVLIRGRILLQELWLQGYDWDDVVASPTAERINSWVGDLPELEKIRIPRVLILGGDLHRFLHVIGDASGLAYGAVAYLVVWYATRRTSRQVYAKGKVAPVKSVSTPRLELQAAVVSTEVKEKVYSTLEIPEENIYFWSDSMDVIHWSRSVSRNHKPFVANRISVMHERSKPKQWEHIAGDMNPADVLSRGCDPKMLQTHQLWWEGPTFLLNSPDAWPKVDIDENVQPKELRSIKYTFVNYVPSELDSRFQSLMERVSSLAKLLRIVAYALRFLLGSAGSTIQEGVIKVEERWESMNVLIRDEQSTHFKKEKCSLYSDRFAVPTSSKIRKLLPWIDEEGIMRSYTRLQAAKFLSWDVRNPIILPRYGRLTFLVVMKIHQDEGHAGIGGTLNMFRMKYCCMADREVVREVLGHCLKCKKDAMKPILQLMGNLPKCRIDVKVRPFQSTSVDMAGPFETMQGRGRSRAKRWLCLFACTVTRAVHLEMAYSLSSDDFMLTLERFTHRRGVPADMYADNGTNFVGTKNGLEELKEKWNLSDIEEKAAAMNMKWHFQPPAAPHHGGAHESLIKVAKKQIYKILSGADIRDQELMTAFTKAEGLLNKRPMSYCSNPFTDEPVLTPGHFIMGNAAVDVVPAEDDEFGKNSSERWRRVQELINHYWKRFIPEWISTLGPRSKWLKTFQNVEVDDVVMVPDLSERKGHWPLGRVTKTYPGKDGMVRVVDVKVKNKIYRRPIVKLYPLSKG